MSTIEMFKMVEEIYRSEDKLKYALHSNNIISYIAIALSSPSVLYDVINKGNVHHKINVIENGSLKQVRILLDDDSPVVRFRAEEQEKILDAYVFHSYVTKEKIERIINHCSVKDEEFFLGDENPIIAKLLKYRDHCTNIVTLLQDFELFGYIEEDTTLTPSEIQKEANVKYKNYAIIGDTIKILMKKYDFSIEIITISYPNTIKIFQGGECIMEHIIDADYYNLNNPKTFLLAWEYIVIWVREGIMVLKAPDKVFFQILSDNEKYIIKNFGLKE